MEAQVIAPAPARVLGPAERALLAISLLASAAYFLTNELQPYPGCVVVKALGVSPLAALIFMALRGVEGMILGVALSFSCLGDVFLGLGREEFFVFGLGSFLVAHLLYVVLFSRQWTRPLDAAPWRRLLAVVLVIYSAVMIAWLWPSLGGLAVPVAAYVGAITAMGVTASLARFSRPWVVLGAVLFILSDSLIAVGKFKTPIEHVGYAIWGTYYVGQVLIALGFLRGKLAALGR